MASGAVYELAFSKHQDIITSLGEGNAFLVWVMGLILDKNDLHHLASEFLTDSNNDKKIDFIYLDTEERRIVFSQGYYTKKKVTGAPANKASDLNTALAWISSGNVGEVPKKLSIIINDCRDAIENNEIDHIQLYYVHNLPESINVQRELNTIEKYHKKNFEDKGISISAKELGIKEINRIYTNKETDIVIHEEVELTASPILHESGPKWKACVFSMLGSELRDLYNRYGADLFSANYRGFLGTADRKKINNTIKLTAESNKENFWVYNNGITILTKNIDEKNNKIILLGISIINGAQTTGSIGNADEKGEFDKLHILCRAVETTDKETISRIVEYNNTQNVIKSWDRYSNNEVQVKIQREFSAIGHLYSTKRGENISDIDISIENVIQPLIAWLGDYKDANRGRNSIFDRKELYDKAFSTNALHILFVYSLSRCIDNLKINLRNKNKKTEKDENKLVLISHLKFKYFFISLISNCMEEFFGERISKQYVSFDKSISYRSENTIIELASKWHAFADISLTFLVGHISKKDFSTVWNDEDEFISCCNFLQTCITSNMEAMPNQSLTDLKESMISGL